MRTLREEPNPPGIELVPAHVWMGLRRYIDHGIQPGHFLQAVLCNDLREAISRADHVVAPQLGNIVKYLYNYAPGDCWGSPEAYGNWLRKHRERLEADAE